MNPHFIAPAALITLIGVGCSPETTEPTVEVNEARALVMESIEAHGGTDAWYENGLLQFRWVYHMTDKGPDVKVDTIQTVDTCTLEVVHEVPGTEIRFGMGMGQDWIEPKDTEFSPPPRFWSLTPYYFLGIPFVFNDENARFEKLAETMTFEGKDYDQVKITYTSEAGDTPDDYYVLLIDPETKLTRGTYYIVTSKLVAPDGPTPPKFLTLDELQDVDGVKLASSHRTFKMKDGKILDQMRFAEAKDVKFVPRGSVNLRVPE